MTRQSYDTPTAHEAAEASARRGSALLTFGNLLNNASLAIGLGLLAYYAARYAGLVSIFSDVSDSTFRAYAIAIVGIAVVMNLASYFPITHGRRLVGLKPTEPFDWTAWKAQRDEVGVEDEVEEEKDLVSVAAAPDRESMRARQDDRPRPVRQSYPLFNEVEPEVTEPNKGGEATDEAALLAWDDEAPMAPSFSTPTPTASDARDTVVEDEEASSND